MTSSEISDERLEEMIAGLEGLPVGPYWAGDNEADLIDGNGHWLNPDHGDPFWHHVARCDPDTMRSILTELRDRRAAGGEADAYGVYLNDGRFMAIAECSEQDAIDMAESFYETDQYHIRPLYLFA